MRQPIYIIRRDIVRDIIRKVEARGFPYSGHAFGETTADMLISMLWDLPADDKGFVDVSRIANLMFNVRTYKCPGNANKALNLIRLLIKEQREIFTRPELNLGDIECNT